MLASILDHLPFFLGKTRESAAGPIRGRVAPLPAVYRLPPSSAAARYNGTAEGGSPATLIRSVGRPHSILLALLAVACTTGDKPEPDTAPETDTDTDADTDTLECEVAIVGGGAGGLGLAPTPPSPSRRSTEMAPVVTSS